MMKALKAINIIAFRTALAGGTLAGVCHLAQADNGTASPDLACPGKPNCVNSLPGSDLPPLTFTGTPDQAWARLLQQLQADPQMEVIHHDAQQIDAVATTRLGFKDDVRFVLDAPMRRIHFRSKSRVGYYDFGKNASRMRELARRFEGNAAKP